MGALSKGGLKLRCAVVSRRRGGALPRRSAPCRPRPVEPRRATPRRPIRRHRAALAPYSPAGPHRTALFVGTVPPSAAQSPAGPHHAALSYKDLESPKLSPNALTRSVTPSRYA